MEPTSLNGAFKLAILPAILTLILIVGCQSTEPVVQDDDQVSNTVEVTATTAINPTTTQEVQTTVTPTAAAENEPITLNLWTVEDVSSSAEDELGTFFRSSLRGFERANPNFQVDVLIKKPSGKGGVIDFLRTAKEVAPSILPDVAVIDAKDLNQAFADGLIKPLGGRLDRSIVQDLLPAARRMGTINEVLVGVPIGIEMEHTVYNTLTYTGTQVLWSDVLSQSNQYIFPAKGVNGLVNDATLSQYFSAGGTLLNDEGTSKLDDQALRDVLEFYQQALDQGIIDQSILEASTTEELWPIYLEGQARVAQIAVRQYLTDRDLLNNTSFGPLPVQDTTDTPVTVMHGWVLVLVTEDVERQNAALKLMEFFLSTNQNAAWNRINKSIPIRDTAYRQIAGDDPYWQFLTEQLNTAQPEPSIAEYDRIGRIIQQAVEQVIRNEATPEEATNTAIDALAK